MNTEALAVQAENGLKMLFLALVVAFQFIGLAIIIVNTVKNKLI